EAHDDLAADEAARKHAEVEAKKPGAQPAVVAPSPALVRVVRDLEDASERYSRLGLELTASVPEVVTQPVPKAVSARPKPARRPRRPVKTPPTKPKVKPGVLMRPEGAK
ncbi:MAG: hypothetical protein ACI9WU_002118, partial [Myxococcota bacterium]